MQYFLLMLLAAFGVTAVLLFVILGRYADRGLKLTHADETITELHDKLEQALEEQAHLTRRVENLEAIVTSEAWDALQEDPILGEPEKALPHELSDEEKAARQARHQRAS